MVDPSEFESIDEINNLEMEMDLELGIDELDESFLTLEDVQEIENLFEADINY
jgi:hypothetical protein